jgi:DNA-binding HxlR family transcriptional regulator
MTTSLTTPKSTICVALATKVMGDKWTPFLIATLLDGTLRFGQIQTKVPGLNPRTLSARLDSLEQVEIITKQVYDCTPLKVEYTLTQKGKDLYPILNSMKKWGEKYLQNS